LPDVSANAFTRRLPKRAWFPLGVLGTFAALALLAPWIAPYAPSAQLDITHLANQPPSAAHWFGTDQFSRDLLSRALYGARISLTVATLATVMMTTIGTAYGAAAGYLGGWTERVLMRVVDALLAIPRVLLLIVIVALWQGLPVWLLVVVIGTTGWFGLSRIVYGQVVALRDEPYVTAAESLGASRWRVVLRHILPNVFPVILVAASLELGHVIVLEAGLSYLGMGVQPPTASWGNLIHDGADQLGALWWMSVFPGLFIAATAVAASALGDALRDRLDPRSTVIP